MRVACVNNHACSGALARRGSEARSGDCNAYGPGRPRAAVERSASDLIAATEGETRFCHLSGEPLLRFLFRHLPRGRRSLLTACRADARFRTAADQHRRDDGRRAPVSHRARAIRCRYRRHRPFARADGRQDGCAGWRAKNGPLRGDRGEEVQSQRQPVVDGQAIRRTCDGLRRL